MTAADSLIGLVNPKPNSTVMIYDVHASESGALAILDDLYKQKGKLIMRKKEICEMGIYCKYATL